MYRFGNRATREDARKKGAPCSKQEDGGDEIEGDDKEIEVMGLSVKQKAAMIRDLLSSSSEEEDEEVRRKKHTERQRP
jgi:hypothetical protein